MKLTENNILLQNFHPIIFLIALGFLSLTITIGWSCSKKSSSIECISDYLLSNIDSKKVDEFVKYEVGPDVYRKGWEELTGDIAGDAEKDSILFKCGAYEYFLNYDVNLDSLRGKLVFVYTVHSYLKYGNVRQVQTIKKVDELLSIPAE